MFQPASPYARAKVHEGDLERALKLFEHAAEVRPEDCQSVMLQAQLYVSLGKQEKALEISRRGIERARATLELKPDDNRVLNLGAFALLRLGEDKEARQWMNASVDGAPQDSMIQYNAACFYALAGEIEKSLDCLENCIFKIGNINHDWLEHDSDLDNVRDHPRFAAIISNFSD
jgi:adenylate cyclase